MADARVPLAFFDPRPTVIDPHRRYDLTFDVGSASTSRTPRVGLLANGFPDSMAFLDGVIAALRDGHGEFEVVAVEKASPPVALTDEQRTRLEGCDAVVAAYGH
jgi:hypothetical protein